jgi:hypothetical protein
MKESTRQKWQDGLGEFLEPGERVETATRGVRAKFWHIALIFGYVTVALLGRYRTYVVTDKNVYVFQASAWSKYKVTKLIVKRPLDSARVEFQKGYLTLDGEHEAFVGLVGPVKAQGAALVQAASRGSAPAAANAAGSNVTV